MFRKFNSSFFRCLKFDTLISNAVWHRSYYYGKHGPRGEYTKVEEEVEKLSRTEVIRMGLSILKDELKVWANEVKEKIEADPIIFRRPGEIDIAFRFDGDECDKKWIATCDQDHREGYSNCTFAQTPYGSSLFHGNISNRVPKDGRTKKAGYCNITSVRKRVS